MDELHNPEEVLGIFSTVLRSEEGFESYHFKMGSYNDVVSAPFKFTDHDPQTMAVVVLSTPDMFDVSFKKWLESKTSEMGTVREVTEHYGNDLIKNFVLDYLKPLTNKLTDRGIDCKIYHDYDLNEKRRPMFLMQAAGHVAGAAYFYHPDDFKDNNWPPVLKLDPNSKLIGLSVHADYAGHFAFRCVYVLRNVLLPAEFRERTPSQTLESVEEVQTALKEFNENWRLSKYRDIGNPKKRYSEAQMKFFGKPVDERWTVLEEWLHVSKD